jgi:hypothetical protein
MVGLLVEMLLDVKDAPFADLRHADDLSPSRFHVAPEKPDPGPELACHDRREAADVSTGRPASA